MSRKQFAPGAGMEAQVLAAELERALPGFVAYLASTENLFDGGTVHAVLAAASHFVRERPVPTEAWSALAGVLNRLTNGPDPIAAEAACTCFLENLAEANHPIKPYLNGESLRYWTD